MFDLVPMYFAHASAIAFVAATFLLATDLLKLFLEYLMRRLEKRKDPIQRKAAYFRSKYPTELGSGEYASMAAEIYFSDYATRVNGRICSEEEAESRIIRIILDHKEANNG